MYLPPYQVLFLSSQMRLLSGHSQNVSAVNNNGKEWEQCLYVYLFVLWTSSFKTCLKPKTRIFVASTNGEIPSSSQELKEMICTMNFLIMKVLTWIQKMRLKWQEMTVVLFPLDNKGFLWNICKEFAGRMAK